MPAPIASSRNVISHDQAGGTDASTNIGDGRDGAEIASLPVTDAEPPQDAAQGLMTAIDTTKASEHAAEHAKLGSHVRSAMLWNTASLVLTQIAQAAIFLVLANQLDPKTFGVFGLAAVFIDFIYIQGSTAFIDATVRRQDFSARTLATHFWAGMAVIAATTLFFIAVSGGIASVMNEPALPPVLIAMSLTLLPLPFTIAPYAIMKQNMDFKGMAVRNMIASLAGGLIALAVAFTPASGWALVVQRAVQLVLAAVIVMINTRWAPTLAFNKPEAKNYLSATGKIFTAQGVCGAVPRVVDLIVAFFYGTGVLGALRVAMKLVDVVLAALVNPIAQMWVVLISKAGDRMEERRTIFLQLSKLTAVISLPGFAGIALVAGDFNQIALKSDYAAVGPMLAIMCGIYLFVPFTYFRNSVLTSLNRLNMLVWFAVIDLVVVVIGMLAATLTHDWIWVLLASGLPNITSMAFALPLVTREMGVRKRDFFTGLTPPYYATGLMALGVLAFHNAAPIADPWLGLISKALVGAVLYVGFLLLFYRSWSLDVLKALRAG
jgi:PST family polysaccharide transporter